MQAAAGAGVWAQPLSAGSENRHVWSAAALQHCTGQQEMLEHAVPCSVYCNSKQFQTMKAISVVLEPLPNFKSNGSCILLDTQHLSGVITCTS